jgi:hypothetical protein
MPRSAINPVTSKPVTSKPVNNSAIQNRIGNEPNFFSSIKQGFGFGIGSSIAHNIFDSKEAQPQHQQPVIDKTREFKQCMEKTYNNYEECAPILK